MRRKSLMSGSEGGCWKSGTLCAQLAGFLPYVKYGFEEQSGGATSPADFNCPPVDAIFFFWGGKKVLWPCMIIMISCPLPRSHLFK